MSTDTGDEEEELTDPERRTAVTAADVLKMLDVYFQLSDQGDPQMLSNRAMLTRNVKQFKFRPKNKSDKIFV